MIAANKENIDKENSALLNLRTYHSDEDEMPTWRGIPKVNLQLFCNTLKILVFIHPICIYYKVQKYSELSDQMKALLDYHLPKTFENNEKMYQSKQSQWNFLCRLYIKFLILN